MHVKEIITALGGPTAVGRGLEISSQAVSLWATQNQIPTDRVPALLHMARAAGLPMRAADLRSDIDWDSVCCSQGAAA